jgi:Tol biopolymer transport system component
VPIEALYWLDPDNQTWLRLFPDHPDLSTLTTLTDLQGVLALGSSLPAASGAGSLAAAQGQWTGELVGCPQPGKWAISVWNGPLGTPADQAFATCPDVTVAAAYRIDPDSQTWERYLADRPQISDITTLESYDGVLTFGSSQPFEEPTRYSRGIYTMASDGSGRSLLVDRTGSAVGPPNSGGSGRTYSASADGQRIAFIADGYGGTVYLLDRSASGAPVPLLSGASVRDLALSRDGRLLAILGWDTFSVLPTDGGPAIPLSHFSWVSGLDWSPDGSRMALAARIGDTERFGVYIAELDGGEPRRLADGDVVSWSPDGQRIAFAVVWGLDDEMGVYSTDAEGNVTKLSETTPSYRTALAWSPDGGSIAFAEASETPSATQIHVVDIERGTETALGRGSDPVWSPDGSRLAFLRDGNLWLMNRDGGQQTRLTNPSQPFVAEPAWTSDGSHLLFSFVPPFAASIYLIDPDGSNETNIADGWLPVWSPDGQKIAFEGDSSGGGLGGWGALYVMDKDGRRTLKVGQYDWGDVIPMCRHGTGWSWSPDGQFILYDDMVAGQVFVARADGVGSQAVAEGFSPAWSVDGREIAFSSAKPTEPGEYYAYCKLYVVNLASGGVRKLTNGDDPAWSPDGKRIAFLRPSDHDDYAVYVVNVDGSGERRLAENAESWSDLAWSPDSTRLAVTLYRHEQTGETVQDGLYVIDLASGSATKIAPAGYAVWSPAGTEVAYTVWADSSSSIHIANADGSGQPRKLTDGDHPSWSPDGERIAFTR